MGEGRTGLRRLTRQQFLALGAGAGAGLFVAGGGGGAQHNPARRGAGGGAGLFVAGCGGGAQNSPAVQGAGGDGGKTYEGPKVELAFWNGFTGGDGPFMRELVEQFSSENTNIDVKMNSVEWVDYYTTVPSAVRSGKGPDVGIMHSDQLGTNAARGVIIPLDDVSSALGLKESDFASLIWQAGMYNGNRYGIPLDSHPLGLYYNKALMEEAGLDPNKPPPTRDAAEPAPA